MRRYGVLDGSMEIDIPASVQRCPYCGEYLTATFESWVDDGGRWKADEIHLHCKNVDLDQSHYFEPYVYQLPACEKALEWVNDHFRFNVEVTRER